MTSYQNLESDTRPWGRWEVVTLGPTYVVKRIVVNAGASLSLQRHQWRDEHWVIVEGEGDVTLGSVTRRVKANEALFIPAGETHRVSNPGPDPLTLIEVQTGARLEESDIERLDDQYGRA